MRRMVSRSTAATFASRPLSPVPFPQASACPYWPNELGHLDLAYALLQRQECFLDGAPGFRGGEAGTGSGRLRGRRGVGRLDGRGRRLTVPRPGRRTPAPDQLTYIADFARPPLVDRRHRR